MPKTINEQVEDLSDVVKNKIDSLILKGWTITSISKKYDLKYKVVQAYLWQQDLLPLTGLKSYISRRVARIPKATKEPDRQKIHDDLDWSINNLYFRVKTLTEQLNQGKKK